MAVLTRIHCDCGSKDGWRIDEHTAECWDCGDVRRRVQIMPRMGDRLFMNGDGDSGGVYHPGAGRRFRSSKEMESWADANGFEMVSTSSSTWKEHKDRNRNAADLDARRDGWSSAEERAETIRDKNKQRDLINANRQRQIDATTQNTAPRAAATSNSLTQRRPRVKATTPTWSFQCQTQTRPLRVFLPKG